MSLFSDEFGVDNSEIDNTEITTTLLYFSQEELIEFKKLCKKEIKNLYGEDFTEGTISDVLLKILRQRNENVQP